METKKAPCARRRVLINAVPALAHVKRRAFTLIELLVVIAITALLAAILFPVFAGAREKARAATCLAQEKQISLAVLSYSSDWDETFPLTRFHGDGPTYDPGVNRGTWFTEVMPYVKNRAVFACPDDPNPAFVADGFWLPNTDFYNGTAGYHVSYAYNYRIGGEVNNGYPYRNIPAQPVTAVDAPAQTVLFCDGNALPVVGVPPESWLPRVPNQDKEQMFIVLRPPWILDDLTNAAVLAPAGTTDANHWSAPAPRHQGFVNVVWADGHARVQKVTDGFYPTRAARAAPCLDPRNGAGEGVGHPPCRP